MWELATLLDTEGSHMAPFYRLAMEALAEFKTLHEQKAELCSAVSSLTDFVLNVDALTTNEFCEAYGVEVPSWRGSVQASAFEFIRIDAIKWRMVKERSKELKKGLTICLSPSQS